VVILLKTIRVQRETGYQTPRFGSRLHSERESVVFDVPMSQRCITCTEEIVVVD